MLHTVSFVVTATWYFILWMVFAQYHVVIQHYCTGIAMCLWPCTRKGVCSFDNVANCPSEKDL